MKLFFVMGAPKSGTTWLQTIMNAHPQVACFGEGHFIDQIVVPMQDMLRRYNNKLEVVAKAVYSGTPCYPPLNGQDAAKVIRRTILSLMHRADPSPDALWWGDKTPAYSPHLKLLDSVFPNCRFIDIVRDPRDVAVSSLHHARRSGFFEDFARDTGKRRDQITFSAGRWAMHARAIDQAKIDFGPRMLQVRYQDLLQNPTPVLWRLYRHLPGVGVTHEIVADVARRCSFTAMSGGRAPGEIDEDSFFRSGTTGRHETELSADELALVESLTR